MSEEKIEKVKSVEKKSRLSSMEEQLAQLNQPVEGKFEAMFDKAEVQNKIGKLESSPSDDTKLQHPEEIAKAQGASNIPSSNDVVVQTKATIERIEGVKETLKTAEADKVDIKKPVRKLMESKLTHIDDSLRIATSKAGTETTTPIATGEKSFSPIENFINHLTHAQYQLESLGNYLDAMANTKGELAPANMLAIQIKVTHIQQEVEFFSNLLNKALESTKALMNVQV